MDHKRPDQPDLNQALLDASRKLSARTVLFHQAVARHLGLNITDHKCLDFVLGMGKATAGQLAEVSYEALVADPEREMERLYRELDLGDFEIVRPRLRQFIAERSNYKRNKFELDLAVQREIARRWRFFFEKYGYPLPPSHDPADVPRSSQTSSPRPA